MRLAGTGTIAALVIGAIVFAFIRISASEDRAAQKMSVGVLPDQSAAALKLSFDPLLEYLALQTGREFELLIPDDYQHLVELFESGAVDLAYFGGLTFAQARQSVGAVPVVMREADRRFTTSFIVRNEPPWDACLQLACDALDGAVLTFGSRLSTSGHLMPRYYLRSELGLVPEDSFGGVRYSGAHDQTALDVQSGAATIGAMNSAIYNSMLADGRIGQDTLVLIWETPPYADYVWAIQNDFDRGTIIAIRDAFLGLSVFEDAEKRILDALRADNFVPASARDFEALVSIAVESGLLPSP